MRIVVTLIMIVQLLVAFELKSAVHTQDNEHLCLILIGLTVAAWFCSRPKMEDSLLGLWIRRKSLEQKAKIEELSQSHSRRAQASD